MTNLSAAYGVGAWHGEGANCWMGGRQGVTDSYTDLFYSARALMATSGRGVGTFIRQTLVGALAAHQCGTSHWYDQFPSGSSLVLRHPVLVPVLQAEITAW